VPYAGNQTYVTFGGQIGNDGDGHDIWQVGLHFADPESTLVPALPTEAQLGDMYARWSTFFGDADNWISTGAVLTWAKAAALDADGAYLGDPVEVMGTVQSGGASGATAGSPQDALAVTLWSGTTFGVANFGRIYLPWWVAPVGLDTCTSGGYTPDVATEAADLIGDLNTLAAGWAGALDAKVCNMSKVGAGTTKQVTSVRVGSVKDTQRRRRNRISETYTTVAV